MEVVRANYSCPIEECNRAFGSSLALRAHIGSHSRVDERARARSVRRRINEEGGGNCAGAGAGAGADAPEELAAADEDLFDFCNGGDGGLGDAWDAEGGIGNGAGLDDDVAEDNDVAVDDENHDDGEVDVAAAEELAEAHAEATAALHGMTADSGAEAAAAAEGATFGAAAAEGAPKSPFIFSHAGERQQRVSAARVLASRSRLGLKLLQIAMAGKVPMSVLDLMLAEIKREFKGCTDASGMPVQLPRLSASLKCTASAVASLLERPPPEQRTVHEVVEATSTAPSYRISATSPVFNIVLAAIDTITDPRFGFSPFVIGPPSPPASGPMFYDSSSSSNHGRAVYAAAAARVTRKHAAAIERLRCTLRKNDLQLEEWHLLFSLFNDGAAVGSASESVTTVLGRFEFFKNDVIARSTAGVFPIGIINPPKDKKPSAARSRAGQRLLQKILYDMIFPQVRDSEENPTVISWMDGGQRRVALITIAPLQFIGDLISHYFVAGIISGRNLFCIADGGMLPKDIGMEHTPGTTFRWDERLRNGRAASALYDKRDAAGLGTSARVDAARLLDEAGLHKARPLLLEALFKDLRAGHAGVTRMDPLHMFATPGAVGAQVLDHIVGYIQLSYPLTKSGALSAEASAAVTRYAARIMEGDAFADGVSTPVAKIYNYNPAPHGETSRRTAAFEKSVLERALPQLDKSIIPNDSRLAISRRILELAQRISTALRCHTISTEYAKEASQLVVELAAMTVEHFRGERFHSKSVDDDGVRTTSVKFFYLWACFQPWALQFGAPSSGSASIFERFLKLIKDAYEATNKGSKWRFAAADFVHLRSVASRYFPELLDSTTPVKLFEGATTLADFTHAVTKNGASCAPRAFHVFCGALGTTAVSVAHNLSPCDEASRVTFAQKVVSFADKNPSANVLPAPGNSFEATGPSRTPGATLASLIEGAAWTPPVCARLLAAVQLVCGADATLDSCATLSWLKVRSPELNHRLYTGDVVAFRSLLTEDDDTAANAAAGAATTVGEAEMPAVISPYDARYTTIGSVQALFLHNGAHYAILHSFSRPSHSLMNSVNGITYKKNCPRILGSTVGHASTDTIPHLIVVVAEHIAWKVLALPLHNDNKCPSPPPGYPFHGPQRILFSARPDPAHP